MRSWRPWETDTQPPAPSHPNTLGPKPLPQATTLLSIASLLEPSGNENRPVHAIKTSSRTVPPPPLPSILCRPVLHPPGASPYSTNVTPTSTAAAYTPGTTTCTPTTPYYTPTPTSPPTSTTYTYAPLTTTTSRKRKSDVFEEHTTTTTTRTTTTATATATATATITGHPHLYVYDDDPRLNDTLGWESCDQIRVRIRNIIQSGTMRVGEFQATINCSAASYQRFMKQSGPEAGVGSDVYYGACRFFRKRELQGLHQPTPAKRARRDEDLDDDLDVSGIILPGEPEGAVRVHDTCDEVRRHIHALLRRPGIRQVDFLRAIAKSFPAPRKIQSKQLHDFLAKKGATAGNTSCVYYGAYVFFEKRRLRDGRPKSKMRLEMESIHPAGMNTTDIMNIYVGPLGPVPVEDEYGRVVSARPISRPFIRKKTVN
ncbi:hypothetical protein SODALDRAFT_342582 [Sodiomyces alkalinus F11]|uniref:DUF7726 domain-containing protein n=1 Tax=Sodiomyces alkalinus (strain CBS 110278 / VKM F-3762 / F11) TaxID=1314773 RepID=A0A3N2QAJ9_SODAK|nr:hypothetical protein SODALDRAFT_342582 [Sodiomyces alkalinus F11]ROT43685.1 hypothetical protein SODALDRAFT_342582 [Sodiomyces alkalinus F11]